MVDTRDEPVTESRHRTHWTTIVLEECRDGSWRATQRGVPVEGRAETAAAAAGAYCRKVEAGEAE
jgi:hypothetical protein